jgi:hypothetical protein
MNSGNISSIKRPANPGSEDTSSFISNLDEMEIISNKPDANLSQTTMEEQKSNILQASPHDPRVLWSENFRSRVSDLFKEKTVLDVFNLYGGKIPMRTLYFWKRSPSKRAKCGRRTPYEDLEEHLFEWFLIARARKIAIRDQDLSKKAERIATQYSTKALAAGDLEYAQLYAEFKFSNGWLWRFKRRKKMTRRAVSTLIKLSYEDQKRKVVQYFEHIDKQIEEKQVALIVNFDETAVFMEVDVKSTVEIKGTRYCGVVTFGKTKERFTAICAIASNGFKFPLIVILKTQSKDKEKIDKPIEWNSKFSRDLKDAVRKSGTLVLQNNKAWNNANLMENYVLPHILRYIPKSRTPLILMDNCSAHSCDKMLNLYKGSNIEYNFFPPSATAYLQPFDVSIAKSFKSKIRDKFYAWLQDNYIEVKKEGVTKIKPETPIRDDMLKWAIEAWESIDPDIIQSSKMLLISLIKVQ